MFLKWLDFFCTLQVQVQVHLLTLIQLQYNNNKKEVKTELTIYWIKHNKGKKCVAAKGAKLSSWLLPQSGYKWVEVIQQTDYLNDTVQLGILQVHYHYFLH